jgi:glyoxylase-like metal-dependent hydrolase (beta-lactamase superfamily II)
MHLAGDWHMILGRYGSDLLSDPLDCCAYGLATEAGLILFDAGAGRNLPSIGTSLRQAGFVDGPSFLFLTHGHADHAGGAATLKAEFGCKVYGGTQTAEWLTNGNEEAISLPSARASGVYPLHYTLSACTFDATFADGDAVMVGGARITALATPGHSADHMSYLVTHNGTTTLIAGDAVFAGGTVILQDCWDSSVADTCRTIRRLKALDFDMLLAGHGAPLLSSATSAVDIAMERVGRMLPPLNFV